MPIHPLIWIITVQSKLISYLESQRRDAQWAPLLQSFVHEASSALGRDESRRLMVKAGMRAAREMALPQCDSVGQMEIEANRHWARLGWGVVSFTERRDSLDISHECVPADPPAQQGLADFLEGVYQQWFVSVGAGAQLQVRQYQSAEEGIFLYRLAG